MEQALTDEDRSVLRLHNRALRTVTRQLRRKVDRIEKNADEVFLELCKSDLPAVYAMGELWGSGNFDCGPQDYEWIVKRCLEAVREYDERHTSPVTGGIELVSTRMQGVDCPYCEYGTEHTHK